MKNMHIVAIAVVLGLLAGPAGAQVFKVPAHYATIQQALVAATPGTTILVDPGIYVENLFWPKVDGIRLVSVSGADRTVIDGGSRGRVVQFPSGLTRATLLQGFTLTGGQDREGAGVRILSSPTLRYNRIVGNRGTHATENNGAGILVSGGGSPLLDRNLISGNQLLNGGRGRGAGICVTGGGAPEIQGNRILGNTCYGSLMAEGGGVYVDGVLASGAILSGNIIADNTCASNVSALGGGVAVFGGPAHLLNNTVVQNEVTAPAEVRGGGIFLGQGARPGTRMANNIVAWNKNGGGIHVLAGSPALEHNDLWHNAGGNYVGVAPGKNDVSKDPVFAGQGDYHLTAASPLIDAGVNLKDTAVNHPDWDGHPRFLDGDLDGLKGDAARADIGADEYSRAKVIVQGTPWTGSIILFDVLGPTGSIFHLFWSPDAGTQLIQPFGQMLIGPRLSYLGGGSTRGQILVQVPPSPFLTGVPVYVQGVVAMAGAGGIVGNMTRLIDLTLLEPARFIREPFQDTKMADTARTTALWTRGPGKPGLFATFGYGGTGADGDLNLGGLLTLDSSTRKPGPNGVVEWHYRSVNIQSTGVLTLVGPYPIRIQVQGNCTVAGTVNASGLNGLAGPPGQASQAGRVPGGRGGPGAGAGGASNVHPLHPIGTLPMELRGGPGYPKANRCGEVNKSDNRLITVVEPNCGGGTGGNRGLPSGMILRSGCSGNGGGHGTSGIQTDYLCSNIGAYGREPTVKWIVATGPTGVSSPTAGTGGGGGGNAAITTGNPSPKNDIVAGSGGGAGGGVEFACFETVNVKSGASILARGGSGGRGHSTVVSSTTVSGGWGAGGSGGSLWLSGTSLVVENGATLDARGGTGNPNPPTPTRTGNGGDGYLILRDRGGNPDLRSSSLFPAPVKGRALFDPPMNGMSEAYSLFYDSGLAHPRWAFNFSDPKTGEVFPGGDMIFTNPPGPNQKVYIFFQGAPDLSGKPDPNPASWFPQHNSYTADISKIRVKGGMQHIRFKLVIDVGKRVKGQPPQNLVTIHSVAILF